jgi:hypothetical protein
MSKATHDHDTLPGALVQRAVVISTPRGNDERKYSGSIEWQSQDGLMTCESLHIALGY